MKDIKKLLCILLLSFQHLFTSKSVPSITVFVHGSQNATKLLSKDIWHCQQGLHHIHELSNSSLFLKDAQLLQEGDAARFNVNNYYTFGWSGKVNFKVREKAGEKLFEQLSELLQKHRKQYGAYPAVRIITNSHGGNIALNMMKYLPFVGDHKVELELIMLACPVQKVTEKLIEHPGITRSYVIYSTFDVIQRLDYYKYEGKIYFPKRIFDTQCKNCKQILVKVNGKRLAHTDFTHSFVRHIPELLKIADATEVNDNRCMNCNIDDLGFLFYNGFNIHSSMKAKRKNC